MCQVSLLLHRQVQLSLLDRRVGRWVDKRGWQNPLDQSALFRGLHNVLHVTLAFDARIHTKAITQKVHPVTFANTL